MACSKPPLNPNKEPLSSVADSNLSRALCIVSYDPEIDWTRAKVTVANSRVGKSLEIWAYSLGTAALKE